MMITIIGRLRRIRQVMMFTSATRIFYVHVILQPNLHFNPIRPATSTTRHLSFFSMRYLLATFNTRIIITWLAMKRDAGSPQRVYLQSNLQLHRRL